MGAVSSNRRGRNGGAPDLPEHLAFLWRPVALRSRPEDFNRMQGNRVPQDVTVGLRFKKQITTYPARVIIDTGAPSSLIAAPKGFFDGREPMFGRVKILAEWYNCVDLTVFVSFNGTVVRDLRAQILDRDIIVDGQPWSGILGMDVMHKSHVYVDRGTFLMLGIMEENLDTVF